VIKWNTVRLAGKFMVPSKELKGEENTHQPLRHLMPNCNLFDSISNPSLRWIAIANEKI
jgi:hypothetical protein